MTNKIKYILVFLIFILISFIIITFPKIYFHFHDQNMLNHVNIKQLNLENIYDNYNLTNDEKLNILLSGYANNFLMLEYPTRESYEYNITNVKDEIGKINKSLSSIFDEYFLFNYDDLTSFNIEKIYLSSNDYRGLTLTNIFYSNDAFEINVVMDAYDNTIFGLSIANTGLKNYPLNIDISLENLEFDFKKYLNVNRDLDYIVDTDFNDCFENCQILNLTIDYSAIYDEKIFDY